MYVTPGYVAKLGMRGSPVLSRLVHGLELLVGKLVQNSIRLRCLAAQRNYTPS